MLIHSSISSWYKSERKQEIAVLLTFDNKTCAFDEPGRLVVFSWQSGAWRSARELPLYEMVEKTSLRLRECMNRVVEFLGECRVFVAASVAGIPYYELEKHHCSVWEAAGEVEWLMDDVWISESREMAEKMSGKAARRCGGVGNVSDKRKRSANAASGNVVAFPVGRLWSGRT